MAFRVAAAPDVDAVTETITLAFRDDPIWGVALAGAADLTAEQQQEVDELIAANLSPERAHAYALLWERFETSHPEGLQHMYLSLLATHPDHRGRGIGQQLLAENLAAFDAEGLPSYLESTNPANDHRYQRVGFRPIGRFQAVIDDATVTTMWRDARTS